VHSFEGGASRLVRIACSELGYLVSKGGSTVMRPYCNSASRPAPTDGPNHRVPAILLTVRQPPSEDRSSQDCAQVNSPDVPFRGVHNEGRRQPAPYASCCLIENYSEHQILQCRSRLAGDHVERPQRVPSPRYPMLGPTSSFRSDT